MSRALASLVLLAAAPLPAQVVAPTPPAAPGTWTVPSAPLALAPMAPRLAAITARGERLAPLAALAAVEGAAAPERTPPAAWLQGDPADSLYRAARQLLARGRYADAANAFREVPRRYPRSGYVAESYYWHAFALQRLGGTTNLRVALASLEQQRRALPARGEDAERKRSENEALAARIRAQLASQGDADAAAEVAEAAEAAAAPEPPEPPVAVTASGRAPRPPRPPRPPRGGVTVHDGDDDACDNEDDVATAALQGLMQMDSERAMPVLRKVLARRDPGSYCLRRRAVFIVAQQHGEGTERTLLEVARTDPDAGVRGQAVFWLSQVQGPAAVAALDSILRTSKDSAVQEKAIFAIAQQQDPKAADLLRDYAARDGAPEELRAQAIFWLGQRREPVSTAFLRDLYGKLRNEELKRRILFAVSQGGDEGAGAWLAEIARNRAEPIEVRKQALFWAGQRGASTAEIATLYAQLDDPEMKRQAVFVLAQRRDRAAVDQLITIAKTEKDPEIRRTAIFWLGQSRDPRAAEALEQFLTGEQK